MEPWLDWLKRVTSEAEKKLGELGYDDWLTKQRRKKWRWAKRIANMSEDRWALKASLWDPQWSIKASRGVGRPKLRWDQDILAFLNEQKITNPWLEVAKQPLWEELEPLFVSR